MNDTPHDVDLALRERFSSRSPAERIKMGCSMFTFSRRLVTSGIARETEGLAAADLRERLFRIYYAGDFSAEQTERIVAHLRSAM